MMMKVRILPRLAVVVMFTAVGAAGGQAASGGGKPQQPRPVLLALDTDRDGTLSAAEIAAAPKVLLSLDRNGDGQLTDDELSQRREEAVVNSDALVAQLMAFDKNGDGVLTADELPARMQGFLTRGDTDHDGKLTVVEIRALAGRSGAPAGPVTKPGGAGGAMRMDPILNALDADHDGVISAAEIAVASTSLLTLDVNHDGQITRDEMRMKQMTAAERAVHMLDEWDTNKDGKLSKDEAPERMGNDFAKIDLNGDGFLDADELTKYFAAQAEGAPRGGGPASSGGPEAPKGGK